MSTFVSNPILLLFAVVGVGTALGSIRVRGFSLGPAAVLFVGLAASAWNHKWVLSAELQTLGLVLFTYTVGLACGPAFAASLRRRGLRSIAAVAVMLAAAAAVVVVAGHVLRLGGAGSAGMFAGALTNTPALGAVVSSTGDDPAAAVGYSLAYPLGVMGALVAAHVALRRARRVEATTIRPIVAWTIEVQRDDLPSLGVLAGVGLNLTRLERNGELLLAKDELLPRRGDLMTVVGPEDDVARFTDSIGVRSERNLQADRSTFDFRRIIVSSPQAVGSSIAELSLADRFGATATRVRRGDLDMLATGELILESGDRVRCVAPVEQLDALAAFLGDSESALSEIDFVALAGGMVAGMLLGLVTFPGGVSLGAAGGTLIAGLALGALGRVGPVRFSLGHQTSLAFRQIGTVVFLAAVGTRSGQAFAESAFSIDGLEIVLAGAAVTAVAMAVAFVAARRLAGIDGFSLAGAIAGAQTQPAVLGFAETQSHNDHRVALGYTALYPAAMILKIVVAQILVHLV
jgi:putative transport protein